MDSTIKILDHGQEAFDHIFHRIDCARKSIQVGCFVWRDDETGRLTARHLLSAADRGVSVQIRKDAMGAIYEYFDPNMLSFFHKKLSLSDRARVEGLCAVYGHGSPRKQRPSPLAQALAAHPNIELHTNEKIYDHSKVFVFDEETIIVGGMGMGDDFRSRWVDFMVELDHPRYVERFRAHRLGPRPVDWDDAIDFVVNVFLPGGGKRFDVLPTRLAAISAARRSIIMEMAYLGDSRITDALVSALDRGLRVELLVSGRANIQHDLNLRTIAELFRRTRYPELFHPYLHPRMLHSKLMIFDEAQAQIGSTNCTTVSHDGFEETDVWIRHRPTVRRLVDVVRRHQAQSRFLTSPPLYSSLYAAIEKRLQDGHSHAPMDDG